MEMPGRTPVLIGITMLALSAVAAGGASALQTATLRASFRPDRLGEPTNLSAVASFGSSMPGPLSPVTSVTTFGPAGMSIDVHGAGICTAGVKRMRELGPTACPLDSRLGFGRASGLIEIAGGLVPEPLTLELFLAPAEHGRLAMLIYAAGTSPAIEQLAALGTEVRAPKPYGLGLSIAVPIVPSLPGAAPGWVENVLVSLGSANAAYYRTIHGRKRLVHVRGVTVPRSCPHGGFPIKAELAFADGSSTEARTAIPCPSR
jgi:hypothetical protein